ncbi:MAG: hypothetical protein ACXVZR_15175 [Terriglobales bacterium]
MLDVPKILELLLLFWIAWRIEQIAARFKERFPREKETDLDWAQKDPMGHWEAHKKD